MSLFSNQKSLMIVCFVGKFFLANIVAILATSFLLSFYSSRYHVSSSLNALPICHYEPNSHMIRAYEGYMNGVLDSNGFNNRFCVERNIQILPPGQTNKQTNKQIHSLLLGSSETEATHVPTDKNCAYLINKRFESNNAFLLYNASFSGMRLVDIIGVYEDALDYFQPSHIAIIETRNLPNRKVIKSAPGKKEVNKEQARFNLARFLSDNVICLRELLSLVIKIRDGAKETANDYAQDEGWNEKNVVDLRNFLQRFSIPSRVRGVQPVIFFHPRFTLQPDGSATFDVDLKEIELWQAECEKQGIVFVCLGDRFMYEYEENNILPYGFWNTLPNTGHLNKDGHRMIADVLGKVIMRLEKERKENAL